MGVTEHWGCSQAVMGRIGQGIFSLQECVQTCGRTPCIAVSTA